MRQRHWVVFGEDWGAFPSTLMHVVRTLLEQKQIDQVIWVNSLGLRSPRLSWHDLQRLGKKFVALFAKKQPKDAVWSKAQPTLIAPLCLPFWHWPWVARLNGWLLAMQIEKKCQALGLEAFDVITNMPTSEPVLHRLHYRQLLYYIQDDFSTFPGVDHAMVEVFEKKLCARADHVLVVSKALGEKWHPYQPTLLPQGVDVAFFRKPQAPAFTYDGPVIGYWGSLNAWVDLTVFVKIAKAFPQALLLILGEATVDLSPLHAYDNIRLIGQVPYAHLPAYGQHWDVSIALYDAQVASIAGCAPVKVWEYIALGKPAVVSDVPACHGQGIDPYLMYAQTPDDFLKAIAKCLEGSEPFVSGVDFLRKRHGWQKRSQTLLQQLYS